MTDYKGHDYTELFPVLGVEWNDDDPDTDADVFRMGLVRLQQRSDEGEDISDELNHIRLYLRAMIACEVDCWGPVWDGLLELEDEFTFLQACISLADHMWT
jgi:hypothetical protein